MSSRLCPNRKINSRAAGYSASKKLRARQQTRRNQKVLSKYAILVLQTRARVQVHHATSKGTLGGVRSPEKHCEPIVELRPDYRRPPSPHRKCSEVKRPTV